MHYVRKVEQDKYDIRSRSYYVYKCSICGEEKWFNWVERFDTSRLRKCTACGVEDDTNDKEYLIKRKHELEQKIKSLSEEMNKSSLELEQVSMKLETVFCETAKETTRV